MKYTDFSEIEEIGSGAYETFYTARYRPTYEERRIVLKSFKNFDQMLDLFISEISNL